MNTRTQSRHPRSWATMRAALITIAVSWAPQFAAASGSEGYWLLDGGGGVFNFGDAASYGGLGAVRLGSPIVGMDATPDDKGYWLVAANGGVFSFGDAVFHGSLGNVKLASPIVDMDATPDGKGYWLVAADGGVFSFGDALFHGSLGSVKLGTPIIGIEATGEMAPVPNPASVWLFGVGLAGLVAFKPSMWRRLPRG